MYWTEGESKYYRRIANLADMLFKLIVWEDAQERGKELVTKGREENDVNLKLREFEEHVGGQVTASNLVTSTFPRNLKNICDRYLCTFSHFGTRASGHNTLFSCLFIQKRKEAGGVSIRYIAEPTLDLTVCEILLFPLNVQARSILLILKRLTYPDGV